MATPMTPAGNMATFADKGTSGFRILPPHCGHFVKIPGGLKSTVTVRPHLGHRVRTVGWVQLIRVASDAPYTSISDRTTPRAYGRLIRKIWPAKPVPPTTGWFQYVSVHPGGDAPSCSLVERPDRPMPRRGDSRWRTIAKVGLLAPPDVFSGDFRIAGRLEYQPPTRILYAATNRPPTGGTFSNFRRGDVNPGGDDIGAFRTR